MKRSKKLFFPLQNLITLHKCLFGKENGRELELTKERKLAGRKEMIGDELKNFLIALKRVSHPVERHLQAHTPA